MSPKDISIIMNTITTLYQEILNDAGPSEWSTKEFKDAMIILLREMKEAIEKE